MTQFGPSGSPHLLLKLSEPQFPHGESRDNERGVVRFEYENG